MAGYEAPIDTNTGRFLQRDPLGYVDGMNLFEYVKSKPMRNTDPLGQYYTRTGEKGYRGTSYVCCKIKETHSVTMPLGAGYIMGHRSTCKQNSIRNLNDLKPLAACKCAYKHNKNITVYDAHAGRCCWCDAYFVYRKVERPWYEELPLIRSALHGRLKVICENGSSWEANVTGGTNLNVDTSNVDIDHFNKHKASWVAIPLARLNCKASGDWKNKIGNIKHVFYNEWFYNCWDYAKKWGKAMNNICP